MKIISPNHLSLACIILALQHGHAATTLVGTFDSPLVTNYAAPFSEAVNLSTGIDWVKYQGGSNLSQKNGATYLTPALVGSFTPDVASFTPALGYEFSWNDGTPTSSASDNRQHTRLTSTASNVGWQVTAAGLSSLPEGQYYRLELWAARTDDTPVTLSLNDGTNSLGAYTINGDTVNDGVATDAIYSFVNFTVGSESDILNFQFVRDAVNGTVGTTSADHRIPAIGAWKLTLVVPEPSAALLGGVGTLLLLRRRRN